MNTCLRVNKLFKALIRFLRYSILMIFMLLGAWCLPPSMFEKISHEMRAKFNIELVMKRKRGRVR